MSILVLDDDDDVALAARLLLARRCGPVRTLHRPAELLPALRAEPAAVLLLDMNFQPGQTDGAQGLALLAQVLRLPEAPQVIVMTAYAEVELAVQALKMGASDFVTKPWDNTRLVSMVQGLLQRRPARAGGELPGEPLGALLGDAPAMQALRRQLARLAPLTSGSLPVCLQGDPGTGKRLAARALHGLMQAAAGKSLGWIELPQAVGEQGLLDEPRLRTLLQAHEAGCLVLTAPHRLAASAQRGLLDTLRSHAQWRLITLSRPTDAASQEALLPEFRAWIETVTFQVPALRDRPEDVLPLAVHFLGQLAARHRQAPRPLSESAAAALRAHDWPGNVAALSRACERAVLLAQGPRYEAEDFGLTLPAESVLESAPEAAQGEGGASVNLLALERQALLDALSQSEGNISQAARLLGLSRAALYRRMEKHELS